MSANARGLELNLDDALPTEGDILFAMQRQRTRIVQRMDRGIDADGQPFAPYSPAYAKKRDKSGRNVSPVDLTWSGRMRNSMQVSADNFRLGPGASEERIGLKDFKSKARQGRVGIYDPENAAKAEGHNEGTAKLPRRHFLDSSPEDNRNVALDLEERWAQRFRARR